MSNRTSKPIQIPLPIQGETFQITLTRGYVATVDAIDADLSQMNWCINGQEPNAYARRNNGERNIYMHRTIMERVLNRDMLSKELVDHINGNKVDNRRENLRLATGSQNQGNRKTSKNKSGYKGVWQYPGRKKPWVAEITMNFKRVRLGYFYTAEEAYAAYCKAAKEHFGEFARL